MVSFNTLLVFFLSLWIITQVNSCNKDNCSSIVSKCLLIKTCNCTPNNCPCLNEFLRCLGEKYSKQCCSCVDFCSKSSSKPRNVLSKKSHVEEFSGLPELFNVLITLKPEGMEWDIVTYETNLEDGAKDSKLNLENGMKYYVDSKNSNEYQDLEDAAFERQITKVNCSVIYIASCISWNKCRQSCQSFGASSYRWFHDGCCECVGETCINYGLNESRCRHCPEEIDDKDEGDKYVIDDGTQESEDETHIFQFL